MRREYKLAVFNEIIDEIKGVLKEDINLSDINFVDSFRNTQRENPLVNTIVTLGIKSVEIKDKSFGRYLGTRNGNECFGKKGIIEVSLNIYVPKSLSGKTAEDVFYNICNALLFNDIQEQILSIKCSSLNLNKEAGAFVLELSIKLESIIYKQSDETNITKIIVRGDI